MHEAIKGTRAIALVGPAGAGKTCLAEAMLFASGTIDRQGDTAAKNSIGDWSPEARARGGSTTRADTSPGRLKSQADSMNQGRCN